MNIKITSTLLFVLLAQITFVNAQFVDQIDFQGRDFYEVPRSAKTVVDYISFHTSAGAVREGNSSSTHDISLTQFDDHGDLLWSKRYGQTGIDEVGNAAVRGDNDDIIVVGQRNYSQGLITAIDGVTGTINWTTSVSDIQGTEELTAVAEIGSTGDYIAVGTSRYGSSHEFFVVKFPGATGTPTWSMNNQPPFAIGTPNYQIIPTNMVHIPGQQLMLVTGTVIRGTTTRAFAAHLSTNNGQFTLFKVFDVSINSPTDASTGGDICMINSQESAMVFTTHRGGIGGPCFITYMRLNALLAPSMHLVYDVYQPGSPAVQQEYGYGNNCYLQGNSLAVGMTVGTSPIDQAIGSLQIDLNTGNASNIETYSSFAPLSGNGMTKGQSGQYFFKSGFTSLTDEFQFISSDIPSTALLSLCIEGMTAQPNLATVLSTDVNFTWLLHGTPLSHTIFSDPVNGVYQNHCPANGIGGIISFKKAPTSIDYLSEGGTSIYPSIVRKGENVTIESTVLESTIIVSNALGQQIYSTQTSSTAGVPHILNADVLENGINFISMLDASGTMLSSSRIIKI